MPSIGSAPANQEAGEGAHPIAVAAARSGLSQDVLRVWERRYRAVRPTRAPGGQRLYTDADIERLRLLRMATQGGRSIGLIAELPSPSLARLVSDDAAARERTAPAGSAAADPAAAIAAALAATRALDAAQLGNVLRNALAISGVTAFVESITVPFLRSIGDEWHAGRLSPAHEHLASSVAETVLLEATSALTPAREANRILVATPSAERHSLGAAIVSTTAAAAGWHVLHLGADLPAADIAEAARSARVQAVALSIVYVDDARRVMAELRQLKRLLPDDVELFAGGAGASTLRVPLSRLGVGVFADLAALRAALAQNGATA
ncbi:MAG TPA: MerR family transcriptional regulator [Gemmatimonadaceae bacterium]